MTKAPNTCAVLAVQCLRQAKGASDKKAPGCGATRKSLADLGERSGKPPHEAAPALFQRHDFGGRRMNKSVLAVVLGVVVALGFAFGNYIYSKNIEKTAAQVGGDAGSGKNPNGVQKRDNDRAPGSPSTSGSSQSAVPPASR
jgi:hypothetical protein